MSGRVNVGHSVICFTQGGSTSTVIYLLEPKFVPIDAAVKASSSAPPSTDMVSLLLRRHFGDHVVRPTDAAEAYEADCEQVGQG